MQKSLVIFAGLAGGFQQEQMRAIKQARGKGVRLSNFWNQPYDQTKPSLYSLMHDSLDRLFNSRVNCAAWDMSWRELTALAAADGFSQPDVDGLKYLLSQLATEGLRVSIYVDTTLPHRTYDKSLSDYWQSCLRARQEREDLILVEVLQDHFRLTPSTLPNATVIDFAEHTEIVY